MTIKAAIAEAIRRTPIAGPKTVDWVLARHGNETEATYLYAHAETILAASEAVKVALGGYNDAYCPATHLETSLAALRLPDPEPDAAESFAHYDDLMDDEAIVRYRRNVLERDGHDMAGVNYNSLRRIIARLDKAEANLKIVKEASHD